MIEFSSCVQLILSRPGQTDLRLLILLIVLHRIVAEIFPLLEIEIQNEIFMFKLFTKTLCVCLCEREREGERWGERERCEPMKNFTRASAFSLVPSFVMD